MLTYLLTCHREQATKTSDAFEEHGYKVRICTNVHHTNPNWRGIVPVGEPKRKESHGWEGTLCCTFGHLQILKALLLSKDEFAMVIEDDAIPLVTLEELTGKMAGLQSWDFIHLGAFDQPGETLLGVILSVGADFLAVTKPSSCTCGYLINRRFAEHMIPLLSPVTDHIDCLYQANCDGFTVMQARVGMVAHDRSVPSRRF